MTARLFDPLPPVISPEQAAADREAFRANARRVNRERRTSQAVDCRRAERERNADLIARWADVREALRDLPSIDRTPVRNQLMIMLRDQGMSHNLIGACLGYTQSTTTKVLGGRR